MTKIFWMEQRLGDVPDGNEWLAAGEVKRLRELCFARRREDWRLGRWTAKQAIVAYSGRRCDWDELGRIEIRPSPNGAPEAFVEGRRAPVSISLSHRAGIGLCSIAGGGTILGCDVEKVERRATGFVEDYFTDAEQDAIGRSPEVERDRLISVLWSAKESVLKALGVGLRRATTDVLVHTAGGGDGGWRRLCAHTPEGGTFCGWYRDGGGLVRTVVLAEPGGVCLAQA